MFTILITTVIVLLVLVISLSAAIVYMYRLIKDLSEQVYYFREEWIRTFDNLLTEIGKNQARSVPTTPPTTPTTSPTNTTK